MKKLKIFVGPEGCFPNFEGTFVSASEVAGLELRAERLEQENKKLKEQLMFAPPLPQLDVIPRSEHLRLIADLGRTVTALRKQSTDLQNLCDARSTTIKDLRSQINKINNILGNTSPF